MRTIEWNDGMVKMIDQKALPWELKHRECKTYKDVAKAIQDMTVRGAPAIGVAGGFGLALAAQASKAEDVAAFRQDLEKAAKRLRETRPTAVNLGRALDRLLKLAELDYSSVDEARAAIVKEAEKIAEDDVEVNMRMSAYGAMLIKNGDTILHHCNTGSLATVEYGTALGAIRSAHEDGKKLHVLLAETRPRFQGARLSGWELNNLGISFDIIPDTAVGYYIKSGEIKRCLVGADRIAANGDTANKIGTYQIAVLAKENWVPFYVIAPTTSIDLEIKNGGEIPIEQRDKGEVHSPYGMKIFPDTWPVRNPAFDVTPYSYITGIVTENGLVKPPYMDNLPKMFT